MPLRRLASSARLLLLSVFLLPHHARAYSVETHEQLIDLTWRASIVPLLQTRFPGITPAQLKEAHAYAYGGSVIQDIGYYPFGNALFSDLTHYVRSGDFVNSLLRNARTPDELAFAVGALSHYLGDTIGHAKATNPAVAVELPGLAKKLQTDAINYEQNPHAHVQTEFAFDINEISKHRFAPLKYLEHVGLNVSTDLLARAFYETYGLQLKKILKVQRTTVTGYRFSVRNFIPRFAFAENVLHRDSFPPDVRDAELLKLEADLAQADKDNGWEQYRRKAGIGTYTLAGIVYILPKVGPIALLNIKGPKQDTHQLYVKSVNDTTAALRASLVNLRTPPPATGPHPARQVDFPNRDLDTGQKVRPGGYRLTDDTYARLLDRLTKDPATRIPVGLQEDVLAYYADPNAPIATRKNPKQWERVQTELAQLQTMSTVPEP